MSVRLICNARATCSAGCSGCLHASPHERMDYCGGECDYPADNGDGLTCGRCVPVTEGAA